MEWILLFGLVYTRLLGFLIFLPKLGELELPTFAKAVVCAAITPYFMLSITPQVADLSTVYLFLLIKELALGMFLSFLLGLPLRLPELIGGLIDNQRGAAITDQYNPQSGEESSLLGQLLMACVVVYFYTEHGFSYLLGALATTFSLQPVYGFEYVLTDDWLNTAFVFVNNMLQLFGVLCMPVIAVMLVVDLSLGMTSRYAQSLNVFSLTQPIKAVVGVGMLVLIHPKIYDACLRLMHQFTNELGLL